MKCHYINNKEIGKVLIPGCIGTAVHNDIEYCTCSSYKKPSTKKLLEERVKELELINDRLKTEIKILKHEKGID